VLSDAPTQYEDIVSDSVRVITRYDAETDRWTTTIVGGPLDTWSSIYREDAGPVVQHAKAIEAARNAPPESASADV
jgi:hypothetical protein